MHSVNAATALPANRSLDLESEMRPESNIYNPIGPGKRRQAFQGALAVLKVEKQSKQ